MRKVCTLVTAVFVCACANTDIASGDDVERRDSAGIQIVETSREIWRTGTGWTIDARPAVTIGRQEGDDPYLFGTIVGALRLSDGTIVVADGHAAELRFFDRGGTFVRAAGRRGEGPGEFADLAGLWRCGDNRIYTYDRRSRRVMEWTVDGDYVRSFEVPEPNASRGPYRAVCTPLGEVLIAGWGNTRGLAQLTRSQFVAHIAPIWLLDSEGHVALDLGEYQIADRVFFYNPNTGAGSAGPYPLGKAAQFSADSQYIYLAEGAWLEVVQFRRNGTRARILRGPPQDLTVGDSVLDRYLGRTGSTRDSALVTRIRREQLRLPPNIPALADIRVTPDGYAWVKRFQFPWESQSRWGVFAPSGEFLGHVLMPPAFEVHEIGANYVLGVSRDHLDVERVQLYVLQRSAH